MTDFFNWLGEMVGYAVRVVVDVLGELFGGFWGAIVGFAEGLGVALGINPTLFSLFVLLVGIALLFNGIRALLRRSFIAGLIWLALALLVLGWLVQ
ncbi:hypothetical protein [Litchfieldella xinjiangensis]|uniref:hypothetical protein n=1 Tax=Litchfieldella xinjiangensis TaxID=1166948 RepID=UPI0005BD4434|nr:hypothetical protein [Halomonas xinjiangensis]